MPSARDFLVRDLLAGLVCDAVGSLVGEPSIGHAVALEHSTELPMVPRSLQSTLGLLTATTVAGVTLGGLIGVLSAPALGRFGRLGVRATILVVTAVGFVAVQVLPGLGYPPNPPDVGHAFLTQLTLWTVLGVVLADLAHRLVVRAQTPVVASRTVVSR